MLITLGVILDIRDTLNKAGYPKCSNGYSR